MTKLADIRKPLLERSVALSQGRVFKVRALSAAQTIAVHEAIPLPNPPMKQKPNAGSLAPLIEDTKDPSYLAEHTRASRDRTVAEVAMAIALELPDGTFPASGKADEKKKWVEAAVQEIKDVLTEQEILTLWNTAMVLGGPESVRQFIGTLVIEIEKDSKTGKVLQERDKEIPANYAYTEQALKLMVCERFSQNPATWPETVSAEQMAEYMAFERVKLSEEQNRDRILSGLLLAATMTR